MHFDLARKIKKCIIHLFRIGFLSESYNISLDSFFSNTKIITEYFINDYHIASLALNQQSEIFPKQKWKLEPLE